MPPISKLCFNSMVASFSPNISTQISPTYHALQRTDSDNTDCGIATQIFIVMVMSSTLWVSAIILGIGSLLMFSGANFNTLTPWTSSYIFQGVWFFIFFIFMFWITEIQGILPTCQQPHGRLNTISKMLTRKETTLSN